MSVKISRREEKRNTSLRDFSLAAVLPLLLTGLIGYFLGHSRTVDTAVSISEVGQLNARVDMLDKQVASYEYVTHELDSLLKAFEAAHDARREDFTSLASQPAETVVFDDPLENWIRAEARDYERFREAIIKLEAYAAERLPLEPSRVNPLIATFRKLNQKGHRLLNHRAQTHRAQTAGDRVLSESISEREEDFEDEREALEDKLAKAESSLALKQELIATLQTKLALQDNGPATPTADPISYQAQKSVINAALIEIENISSNLPGGLLGGNKKKEVEADIKRQVGVIENALADIE